MIYIDNGVVKKYRPDFLIQLANKQYMVLETKGQQSAADDAKHVYMKEWVSAVSQDGGFGQWQFAVSKTPADVKDLLVL